jgi:hypothetical protein
MRANKWIAVTYNNNNLFIEEFTSFTIQPIFVEFQCLPDVTLTGDHAPFARVLRH